MLLYTVVGGMVSVVLTDYIQLIILFTSVVLTTYFAIDRVGYGPIVTKVQAQYGEVASTRWRTRIWAGAS